MDVMQQQPPPDDVSDEDMPDVAGHPDELVSSGNRFPLPDASPSAPRRTRTIPQPVCEEIPFRVDQTTAEPDAPEHPSEPSTSNCDPHTDRVRAMLSELPVSEPSFTKRRSVTKSSPDFSAHAHDAS